MNNYTTLNKKLLADETSFLKKMTNGLNKVNTHFIVDMFTGILTSNSIILSDIARNTQSTNIKKTVERIERHLDAYDQISDMIDSNYIDIVKPLINPRKLYFIDGGDITKNEKTKFENMGYILDGSKEHKLAKGYKIFEIDTIDTSNQPLSLVSDLMSSNNKTNDNNKELSENLEWNKRIKNVVKTFGKGTFIGDRGFDGAIFMENIIKNDSDFIIRARNLNRYVYLRGEKIKITDIASKCKGYYKMQSTFNNETHHLKISSFNIVIKSRDAKSLESKPLNLIIVKGYGGTDAYMALLTSRNICGKDKTLQVVRDYILRWKIEDNFKLKKQQYGLEKIKVRRYKRIQIINKLLSIAMVFNNILNLTVLGKVIRKVKNQVRKEIKNWLYRIANGIKIVTSFNAAKIMELLYPKPEPRRRDLFTLYGIRVNY